MRQKHSKSPQSRHYVHYKSKVFTRVALVFISFHFISILISLSFSFIRLLNARVGVHVSVSFTQLNDKETKNEIYHKSVSNCTRFEYTGRAAVA